MTVFEAANYRDVDALVVTAPLEVPGSGYARFFAPLHPADLDPRFAGSLPSGYLTTRPGALRLYYAVFGEFGPLDVRPAARGPLEPGEPRNDVLGSETCFEQSVVRGRSCHQLFPRAPDAFAAIRNWLDPRVGITGAPSDPCRA